MSLRLTLLGALLALTVPASAQADLSEEIVVKRAPNLTAAERADVRADADVQADRPLEYLRRVEVVSADPGERAAALRALRADPDVEWAEPNRVARTQSRPQDEPLWYAMWAISQLSDVDTDAEEAWAVTRGAGVTVGIVDTGVDVAHPDLAGRSVPGRDFVADVVDETNPRDVHGHGTHVAGTVAAGINGVGTVGVAPEARVMALRALDDDGKGSMADVANAFAYAGRIGLRVVNASLGSTSASLVDQEAIRASPNTLFVVSAGNAQASLDTANNFPCEYSEPNLVCVGAHSRTGERSNYSNWSATAVHLSAPGDDIASTLPQSAWGAMYGTSMATPHVAGGAALLASAEPSLSPTEIKSRLLSTTTPGAALTGQSQTAGRLNVGRALNPNGMSTPGDFTLAGTASGWSLSWAAVPEATGYRVWRGTDASWTLVASGSANALDVAGPAGQSARFRVSAYGPAGESARSLVLSAASIPIPTSTATPTPVPAPPVSDPTPAVPEPADPSPQPSPPAAEPVPSTPVPIPTAPTPPSEPAPPAGTPGFTSPAIAPGAPSAPAPPPVRPAPATFVPAASPIFPPVAPTPAVPRPLTATPVTGLRVTGLASSHKSASVRFVLARAGRVTLTVRRAGKSVGSRTRSFARGTARVVVGRRTLLGLLLKPGTYRLSVRAAGASAVQVVLRVR